MKAKARFSIFQLNVPLPFYVNVSACGAAASWRQLERRHNWKIKDWAGKCVYSDLSLWKIDAILGGEKNSF